jgi:preprotein translocase subunit SecA
VRLWIDEVVEDTVRNFTQEEYAEEWDLEALTNAMTALYQTEITAAELREDLGEISRDALIEEFQADARDEYAAKEEEFGSELMRELERFVILQVVDVRWREHLDNMDYLREGVHLRSMAQKDPLVEYTSEGERMFTDLGRSIRAEVVLHLFHAELAPQDAQQELAQQTPPPGNGNVRYEHETASGAEVIDAALGAGASTAAFATAATTAVQAGPHDKIGRNDPCWCGSGKKFKKCHGA